MTFKNNKWRKFWLLAGLMLVIGLAGYIAYKNTPTERVKAALRTEYPIHFGRGAVILGPLSIEEIESQSLTAIALCENCPQTPFGHGNRAWELFKSNIQEGDEIFYFSSDPASWRALAGRQGYALIRDGTLIDVFLTIMS